MGPVATSLPFAAPKVAESGGPKEFSAVSKDDSDPASSDPAMPTDFRVLLASYFSQSAAPGDQSLSGGGNALGITSAEGESPTPKSQTDDEPSDGVTSLWVATLIANFTPGAETAVVGANSNIGPASGSAQFSMTGKESLTVSTGSPQLGVAVAKLPSASTPVGAASLASGANSEITGNSETQEKKTPAQIPPVAAEAKGIIPAATQSVKNLAAPNQASQTIEARATNPQLGTIQREAPPPASQAINGEVVPARRDDSGANIASSSSLKNSEGELSMPPEIEATAAAAETTAARLRDKDLDFDESASEQSGDSMFEASRGVESKGTSPSAEARSLSSIADQIRGRIAEQLTTLRETGHAEVQMNLHPPELGQIQLHLTMDDGTMHVRMTVQDDGVKRLLDQQLEPMRAHFKEMGVGVGQFDVRRDGGSPYREWKDEQQDRSSSSSSRRFVNAMTMNLGSRPSDSTRIDVLA